MGDSWKRYLNSLISKLDVVTPVTVGFFINTTPRPDQPETFTSRLKLFMDQHDDTTKTQVEYGPIWAPSHRVSVYKLMTAFEDIDKVRNTMSNYKPGPHDDVYICMMQFSSLPDAQKTKMVRCQAEYSTNIRSLFLTGIKSIQGTITTEESSDNHQSVARWIHDRMTSYNKRMFTRVYCAVGGVVELHVHKESFKEAIEWVRLATSEIALQLSEDKMGEVFLDPKTAQETIATNPEWKPHSLSAIVDTFPEPTTTPQSSRRRRAIVGIDYAKTSARNTSKVFQKGRGKGANKQHNNRTTAQGPQKEAAVVTPPANAWAGGTRTYTASPKYAINTSVSTDTNDHEEEDDMDLDSESIMPTTPKAGINKYKQAAEVTDKRLGALERRMEKIAQSQVTTTENIDKLTQAQKTTSNNTDKLMVAIVANKRETDNYHIETVGIMNAFQASLNDQNKSMNDVNQMMAKLNAKMDTIIKPSEGETQASTAQPSAETPPHWQDSFADDEDEINIADSYLNNTFSSDAMQSAADEQ